MLDVSSVLDVGVNVAVQVMLSLDDIAVSDPFWTVISSSLLNPVTASEKTRVTVVVSPASKSVSTRTKLLTEGLIVSIE